MTVIQTEILTALVKREWSRPGVGIRDPVESRGVRNVGGLRIERIAEHGRIDVSRSVVADGHRVGDEFAAVPENNAFVSVAKNDGANVEPVSSA